MESAFALRFLNHRLNDSIYPIVYNKLDIIYKINRCIMKLVDKISKGFSKYAKEV